MPRRRYYRRSYSHRPRPNTMWTSDFVSRQVTLSTTEGEPNYQKLFACAPVLQEGGDIVTSQDTAKWDAVLQRIRGDIFLGATASFNNAAAAKVIIYATPMSRQWYDSISQGNDPDDPPPDPESNTEGDDYPLFMPIACINRSVNIIPGQLPIDVKAKRKIGVGDVIGCFMKSVNLTTSSVQFNIGLFARCLWMLRK